MPARTSMIIFAALVVKRIRQASFLFFLLGLLPVFPLFPAYSTVFLIGVIFLSISFASADNYFSC
jgi:hypothetical protein